MRAFPILIALTISVSLQAEQKKGVSDEIGAKLKESFRFEAVPDAKEIDHSKDGILVLEKFAVTKFFKWDLFEQIMDQEHKGRLQEEKFTLKDGGPLASKDFGKVRAQIGLWGTGEGFHFLKIKW